MGYYLTNIPANFVWFSALKWAQIWLIFFWVWPRNQKDLAHELFVDSSGAFFIPSPHLFYLYLLF